MSKSKKVKAYPLFLLTDRTTRAPCDYKGEYQAFGTQEEAYDHVRYDDRPTRFFVLPADAASYDRMVEQMARGMDGLAFHEYKDGDCLPRGEEMSTAAKVNKVQVWRRRSALSNARHALAAIGITRPTTKEDKQS